MSKHFANNQTETGSSCCLAVHNIHGRMRFFLFCSAMWDLGIFIFETMLQLAPSGRCAHATVPDKSARGSSLTQSSFLILGGDWQDDEDNDCAGTQPALGGRLLARLLPRLQEQQELGNRGQVKDDVGQEREAGAWIQLSPGFITSHSMQLHA